MGRAIVRDPQVFLFDEPLSNLDAKLRVQMRSEIKALHQRLSTTTVYVTHDQVEAMTMADRIVVMQDGRVEQVGAPLELYDRPANLFVATFIGSPAMNLIEGQITQAGFVTTRRAHPAAGVCSGRSGGPAGALRHPARALQLGREGVASRPRSWWWSPQDPRPRSWPGSLASPSRPCSASGSTRCRKRWGLGY
jgi:multiple sugar transport system ATP-binding protein